MRQEKFKMERQGLINVGDEIETVSYTHLDVYKRQECTHGTDCTDYGTGF